MSKSRRGLGLFFLGQFVGMAIYQGFLIYKDWTPVSRSHLEEQQVRIADLLRENAELTDDLFASRSQGEIIFSAESGPYDVAANAATLIADAQIRATAERKFLMVTFGANWCLDCRTLDHHLTTEPVASYTRNLFHFVNVDVGKMNVNREVAQSMGVSLNRGIPVAIVFDREGKLLGTTNDGQLEPARHYSSQQILKFVRTIAERERIVAPDSVD